MSNDKQNFTLSDLKLGKPTEYATQYRPSLLQAVPRALNREALGVVDQQPFHGADVWHGYELSWLNAKGKPMVALVRCTVPSRSLNIVESKSFKLYLNSFNQTVFNSEEEVREALHADLSTTVGGDVSIELFAPDNSADFSVIKLPGQCIDGLDIEINNYDLDGGLLKAKSKDGATTETVHSHLLKSNCLITNQPDWASVVIEYSGQAIEHESLLRYLVSFRMHNEFHEQCVERIFMDLFRRFDLKHLSVQALYTRRGGLDINPFRTTEPGAVPPVLRVNRQ